MKGNRLLAVLALVIAANAAAADIAVDSCTRIVVPGSYVLTRDLVNATPRCILIDADSVTLDLDGYAIVGGKDARDAGIADTCCHEGIVVRNGTVAGFDTGVAVVSAGAVIERMHVVANHGVGILAGEGVVRRNVIVRNDHAAITTAPRCVVTGNLVLESTLAKGMP